MMHYSFQPRDRIFWKALSFAKNMGKNINENISKKLSGKYSYKILDHAKKYATGVLKTKSEATGDLIGNRIAKAVAKSYDSKTTKVSRNLKQNNSDTVTNEYDQERPKEKYISSEERQQIIHELRIIYNKGISKNSRSN